MKRRGKLKDGLAEKKTDSIWLMLAKMNAACPSSVFANQGQFIDIAPHLTTNPRINAYYIDVVFVRSGNHTIN